MNAKRPNVVFLFTDDQRFDALHALGNEQIITPNLDRLVNQGCSFTHAHIPGGTCPAVCMPSRAMVNTGKSLFHLQGCGEEIPQDHHLLGETFRHHGYRTFGTGKWHNGVNAYHRSFTDGDEIFFGGMADHWNVPAHRFDPSGRYESRLPYCSNPSNSNKLEYRHGDHIAAGRHSSELLATTAVNFIENYDDDAPFFMYVSFLAPHDPRTMPEEFLRMYDGVEITLPENFMGCHPFNNGELKVRDEMLAALPRDPREIQRHLKEYYAMITHADHEIGKIMAVLETSGKSENTIFVFAGDNGLALGQHGLMGKQNLYDHSTRVPLVFAGPGVPRGQRSEAQVYLFDIFPTLCELTGIDIPAGIDGISLVPAMRETHREMRDFLYLAYKDCQRGICNREFKLIEYVVESKHAMTQLFDLRNDPKEMNNLAGNSAYADKVAELRRKLKETALAWDDPSSPSGRIFWSACEY